MTPVSHTAPESPAAKILPVASPGIFQSHVLTRDLKRNSVRGAAITGVSQAGKFILKFGSTAALARLLTPEDFGLFAMTTVMIGFARMFKDGGLTAATVQRDDISHPQISMLFWINAAIGGLLALLLVAAAPLIAAFYNEPRLRLVTIALSVSFIFGGFSVQHQALLRRQMRFKALAAVELVSIVVGIAVGVSMAALGYGYWSLVGLSIATAAASMIGAWVTLRWIPGRPQRGTSVGPLLKFGSDIMSFNVINYFSRNTDTLLIGWFWGPVALGFYDRAYNMLLVPIRQINAPLAAVAVPTLSRARAEEARFRRFYLNSLQLVTSISVPVVVGLALFADEVVRLWLGPGWERCALLFQLLAPAAAIGAISNPIGWLLISLGHTQKYKQMGLISAAVVVASFVIGLPFGPEGVATAYSIATLLLFVPTWLFLLTGTGIQPVDIVRTLAPPLLCCLPAALVAWLCLQVSPDTPYAWTTTFIGALGFAAIYAYLLLVRCERWDFFRGILAQLSGPSAAR